MTARGERICSLVVILAALAVIVCSGIEQPVGAMIAGVCIVAFALLPLVVGRRR